MSRYKVPSEAKYKIYAGFDNPMQTYFLQVFDVDIEEEDDSLVVWIGGTPNETTNIEDIENALTEYSTLPEDIKKQMLKDYENRTEPTPLQKLAAKLFAESEVKNV